MATARHRVVDSDRNGFYHCIGRCVRQYELCGRDPTSGRDLNYRKQWIVDRARVLSQLFAVDILTPAVMSNHYHLVLKVRPEDVREWSDREVIRRWLQISDLWSLDQTITEPAAEHVDEALADKPRVAELRLRLGSISWYMKYLNEYIARCANREDDCRGHFWSGRFGCRRLMDERSLLTCMMYVDLNPVRAGLAESIGERQVTGAFIRYRAQRAHRTLPGLYRRLKSCLHISRNVVLSQDDLDRLASQMLEELGSSSLSGGHGYSDAGMAHRADLIGKCATSDGLAELKRAAIRGRVLSDSVSRKRLLKLVRAIADQKLAAMESDWLMPLDGKRTPVRGLSLQSYLRLLDETGRRARADKPGVVQANVPSVLQALRIDADAWLVAFDEFILRFPVVAGEQENLRNWALRKGRKWCRGVRFAKRLLGSTCLRLPGDAGALNKDRSQSERPAAPG